MVALGPKITVRSFDSLTVAKEILWKSHEIWRIPGTFTEKYRWASVIPTSFTRASLITWAYWGLKIINISIHFHACFLLLQYMNFYPWRMCGHQERPIVQQSETATPTVLNICSLWVPIERPYVKHSWSRCLIVLNSWSLLVARLQCDLLIPLL